MPANGAAIGILGTDASTWAGATLPLDLAPLGMNGCALRTPVDVTIVLASATWTIPVPTIAPDLIGASFRAQALVIDPAANAFGAVLSNTLRLRTGA